MTNYTRRVILGSLFGGVAGAALANAPTISLSPVPRQAGGLRKVATDAEQLIAAADLTGDVSYVVSDLASGKVLESRLGGTELPPASVTKAITALYALDKLGPDFRYRTRLLAQGTLSNGRLNGDLILAGGGDPTLSTDDLGGMAKRLREIGVTEITGRFLVYAGALPNISEIDKDQPPQVGYNPAISGLNLNFNRVHFEWKRQAGTYQVTMDARARNYAPQVAMARMQIVNRALPVYTYASKSGVDQWTVAQGALGNGGSRWLPVRNPALYAADVFRTVARSHGIALPSGAITQAAPKGTVLIEHVSQDMTTILRDMLKFSTNLTAETVGLSASGQTGGSLKASARAMTAWARQSLGLKSANFVDHSGLGGDSRLSAQEMVVALARASRGPLASILKDIPMQDAKGNTLPNHPVKVKAKTGTLNFASALAGYMTARDGRTLVFAIFSADVPRRNRVKNTGSDVPDGAIGWRNRARRLQLQLIDRWGTAHAVDT